MSEEATTSPTDEELAAALVKELTDARRRGLDRLDLDQGQWKVPGRIEVPNLERMAREYAGDYESSRVALISQLMFAALKEWERKLHKDEAKFVRDLFFAEDGRAPGARNPTELADAVRKHWKITGKAFDDRREAYFSLFARFLIGFVAEKDAPPVAAVAEQQPAEAPAHEPPAQGEKRSGNRLFWLIGGGVVALAVLVIVLIVWGVSSGGDGGGGGGGAGGSGGASQPSATFTFDALGGGSSIIRVFPGVGDAPEDKVHNGTFNDGDTAPAVCKTTGRLVVSDTSVGERERESDVWIRVIGSPGVTQYAPLTYGSIPDDDLEELPSCSD